MDTDPLKSYEGLAAQWAKAKEQEEALGLQSSSETVRKANQQNEVRFKASHGLLIGLLLWFL
jgi:GPI ethanolamine phosphate transferase 3 subunit O